MPPQFESDANAALTEVLAKLPERAGAYYGRDRARIVHDAILSFIPGGSIVDIGSGYSPLCAVLSVLGMKATMVDRFDYPVEAAQGVEIDKVRLALAQFGVEQTKVDFATQALPIRNSSADVVTCLAVIEHLHHSPRSLFEELLRILKPRGRLVVSAPNAVNLRKRISVLVGRTNLPPMHRFYTDGYPFWYGHIHEPTAKELRWLLDKSGFYEIRVFGRNFAGAQNYGLAAKLLSPLLQLRPGLCSDLYAVAHA